MNLCEYCSPENKEENLRGSDGIVFDKASGKNLIYVEHFYGSRHWIEVNYCPQCGKNLQYN